MDILTNEETEQLLASMMEVAMEYDNLASLLGDCRIFWFALIDMPTETGFHARLGHCWIEGYPENEYGPWLLELRRDDPLEEQAASLGHEIAHVILDFLRLGKEPRTKWPNNPKLISKIGWKEDEEKMCDLFSERWLEEISFRSDIFTFLEHIRNSDEFLLLT